jgi:putative tricarboxylic transport membrane protein
VTAGLASLHDHGIHPSARRGRGLVDAADLDEDLRAGFVRRLDEWGRIAPEEHEDRNPFDQRGRDLSAAEFTNVVAHMGTRECRDDDVAAEGTRRKFASSSDASFDLLNRKAKADDAEPTGVRDRGGELRHCGRGETDVQDGDVDTEQVAERRPQAHRAECDALLIEPRGARAVFVSMRPGAVRHHRTGSWGVPVRLREVVIAGGLTGFGLFVAALATSTISSGVQTDPLGPRAVPIALGGGMALCGLLLLIGRFVRAAPRPILIAEGPGEDEDQGPVSPLRLIGAIVATAVYVALLEPIGHILATPAYVLALLVVHGGVPRRALLVAPVVITGVLYVGFRLGLGVPMPGGVLETVFVR